MYNNPSAIAYTLRFLFIIIIIKVCKESSSKTSELHFNKQRKLEFEKKKLTQKSRKNAIYKNIYNFKGLLQNLMRF